MGVTQGCSDGYWKNHPEDWVGFCPDNLFNVVFMRAVFDPDITLLEALQLMGGGINALARQAVGALLNASNPNVNYPFSVNEVREKFQAAFDSGDPTTIETQKNQFEFYNTEFICPLGEDI
ncbi:hypothetical protein [Rossellomorea aquimaris]|uniref:Uncharacterized protein n=1 Tax=Rossellomorea aquimaris TaxID=189382 RepID=A0A1J6W2H4_9BACI|nr:hypothetical protein [Rossellomorea aquimaris]OIU70796.1 hypothetical protein BHE18_20005 [Rossellomorea aquimaris]